LSLGKSRRTAEGISAPRSLNLSSGVKMYLGIDIGTSKTAAVILDHQGKIVALDSHSHGADLPAPPGHHNQDPRGLLESAWDLVAQLPLTMKKEVMAIGVTGQMHGCLVLNEKGEPLTPLINWQDRRCLENPEFLPALQKKTGYRLATGYGSATLAWLLQKGELPPAAHSSCLISDLAVAILGGLKQPVVDPTNAASWGIFNLEHLDWDWEAIRGTGLPFSLFPRVIPSGSRAGFLCEEMAQRLGLTRHAAVTVALGDNQASILASLDDPERQLALTLGTGGQVSAVLTAGGKPPLSNSSCPWECRPFPGNRFALVAAPLCGGLAWKWLAESAQVWMRDLGLNSPELEEVYQKLNQLGLAETSAEDIEITPHFLGERHAVDLRGTISGITLDNFHLGALARALARGIFQNLCSMLPEEALQGRNELIGSGNALARNPLLVRMAEEVFHLPVRLKSFREEAACGAAILAGLRPGLLES
jgi:sedoheptulokinase